MLAQKKAKLTIRVRHSPTDLSCLGWPNTRPHEDHLVNLEAIIHHQGATDKRLHLKLQPQPGASVGSWVAWAGCLDGWLVVGGWVGGGLVVYQWLVVRSTSVPVQAPGFSDIVISCLLPGLVAAEQHDTQDDADNWCLGQETRLKSKLRQPPLPKWFTFSVQVQQKTPCYRDQTPVEAVAGALGFRCSGRANMALMDLRQ